MVHRDGEDEKTWFRSDRFLSADGKWFFITREGEQIGPFDSKLEAQRGAQLYIDHMKKTHNEGKIQANRIAKEGHWESTHYQ